MSKIEYALVTACVGIGLMAGLREITGKVQATLAEVAAALAPEKAQGCDGAGCLEPAAGPERLPTAGR
ncbi:MAG: hypothetical protein U1E14_00870 [Geminicoccaceae bacterium]